VHVCDCLCDVFLVELQNSSYVAPTLKYVIILIVSVTSKYFRSRFLTVSEKQNVKQSVHNWWKRGVELNTVPIKNVMYILQLSFPNLMFLSLLQLFLIFFVWDLRCSQW
jgi:hypothetical protein